MIAVPEGDAFMWPVDDFGARSKTWTVLEGSDLKTCQRLASRLGETLQVEVLPLLPNDGEDVNMMINPRLTRRKKKATRQLRMQGMTSSLLYLLLQKLPQSSSATDGTMAVRTQLFASVFKMFDVNTEQLKSEQPDLLPNPETEHAPKLPDDVKMLCRKIVKSNVVPSGGFVCSDISELGYPLYLGCWVYLCDTVDDTLVLIGNRDPQKLKSQGIKKKSTDVEHFFELIVNSKTQKLQVPIPWA